MRLLELCASGFGARGWPGEGGLRMFGRPLISTSSQAFSLPASSRQRLQPPLRRTPQKPAPLPAGLMLRHELEHEMLVRINFT